MSFLIVFFIILEIFPNNWPVVDERLTGSNIGDMLFFSGVFYLCLLPSCYQTAGSDYNIALNVQELFFEDAGEIHLECHQK